MGLTCPLPFLVGAFLLSTGLLGFAGLFHRFDPRIRARLFSIFSQI